MDVEKLDEFDDKLKKTSNSGKFTFNHRTVSLFLRNMITKIALTHIIDNCGHVRDKIWPK